MSGEVFLSASVPIPGRGEFYKTADPFLIQAAVRELVILMMGRKKLVWGGHPAITPMVWAVCEDLDISYADSVVLYQSKLFEDMYPEENGRFANVVYTEAVPNDRAASLKLMREQMLSRPLLEAAVLIGGMEGIIEECDMFRKLHPDKPVVPVMAPGGAARDVAAGIPNLPAIYDSIDFVDLFLMSVPLGEPRARPPVVE
jgi:hypothetical protein